MPNNSEMQGQYLKSHWDDMMANSAICAGGFAFTWVDEWYRQENRQVEQFAPKEDKNRPRRKFITIFINTSYQHNAKRSKFRTRSQI
jgi:hypothetical protein